MPYAFCGDTKIPQTVEHRSTFHLRMHWQQQGPRHAGECARKMSEPGEKERWRVKSDERTRVPRRANP
jgi:hypothetical protein